MSKLFSNLFSAGKKAKGDAVAAAPLFAANPYAVNAPAAANQPLDDAIAGLLVSTKSRDGTSTAEPSGKKASEGKRRKAAETPGKAAKKQKVAQGGAGPAPGAAAASGTPASETDDATPAAAAGDKPAKAARKSKSKKGAKGAAAAAAAPQAAADSADKPKTADKPGADGAPQANAPETDAGGAAEPGSPSAAEAGDDDGPKAPSYTDEQMTRTVFVGNVPADIDKDHLKVFFGGCGTIETLRLRTVPVMLDSKMPKHLQIKAGKIHGDRATATAFLRFASADSLPAALALNMAVLRENHVRVDRAAQPSAKQAGGVQYDAKRSVFIGNLAFDVKEEDLIRIFNSGAVEPRLLDTVEAVRVVKDANTNVGKGIAYVLFSDRVAALAALNLNETLCRGRKMRVSRVKASAGGVAATKIVGGRAAGKSAYSKGKRAVVSADPADWQGARTKGAGKAKGKALRSTEGGVSKAAPSHGSSASSAARSGGKRPAVLARKAAQLAKLGHITDSQASEVAKASAKRQKNSKAKAKGGSKRKMDS